VWITYCLSVRTSLRSNYRSLCIRLMYPWLAYLYVSMFTLLSHGCYDLQFCLLRVMVWLSQWFYWVYFIIWVVCVLGFQRFFLPRMLINSQPLHSSSLTPAYFPSLLLLIRMYAVPSHYPQPTSIDTNSPAPFHHANLLNSSQLPHDGPSPGLLSSEWEVSVVIFFPELR